MASNLFDLVARAKQRAQAQDANAEMRQAAKRLEKTMNAYISGQRGKWSVEQELKHFENVAGQHAIRQFDRKGGMRKYGLARKAAATLRSITEKLGPIGSVVQKLFEGQREGYTEQQVRAANELLQQIQTTDIVEGPAYTEQIEAAIESLESNNWNVQDTINTNSEGMDELIRPRMKGATSQQGAEDVINDVETPRLSKKHFTPSSSNVYMFQYDYLDKTLYVQFKAPAINQKAVKNYRSQGGMRAMAGDMGNTIKGKTNDPGVLYAYFNVPQQVFRKLINAGSAGKAVWDSLRVRGSVYGHQYRYRVVSGAVVPGEGGKDAIYVPRKAVPSGFKSRSVAAPGTGPRRYVSSSLPQDTRGHRTIAAARHRPTRRSPNRGRTPPPNRGR